MIVFSVLALLPFMATVKGQGFFSREWGKKLEERITSAIEKASQANGISTVNGTTVITQTIGGKKYTAVVPKGASYLLHTSTDTVNGTTTTVIRLTINGSTAVYKTAGGKTTVTDGNGKPLTDGGFFGVVADGQVTDVPSSTEPPVTSKTEELDGREKATKANDTAVTTSEPTGTRDADKLPSTKGKPSVNDI